MRAALVKLYAAVVRAHVTGTSIRYDHYAMVEARAALAQTVSAERVPLTEEQRDALRIVLLRCGHDRRVLCLYDLLNDGITGEPLSALQPCSVSAENPHEH